MDANILGYFRGHDLDVEPNYGASAGLYRDPGYVNAGINVNYRLRGNLTLYANLRNALDGRYEEIYGFPAPLLKRRCGREVESRQSALVRVWIEQRKTPMAPVEGICYLRILLNHWAKTGGSYEMQSMPAGQFLLR